MKSLISPLPLLAAMLRPALVLSVFWAASPAPSLNAQEFDAASFEAMEYRSIGPFRGGRSAAITGVPGDPSTYYFGAAGGGVWTTDDAGQTWSNLSDGFFGGSIGAVAVSDWDPNVIYVGGGEITVRGNVSHGDGVWKSQDRGRTWQHMGLADSRHIPRIRIHPKDPDLVYAAVLGHLYGPNEERGVYRSRDGGATWERVLFANENAGAVDLVMDPSNPRVLYASTWRILRTPYSLESGGEGSGLWKSSDGGDSWTDITHNEGMPEGMVGIIGVAVSPATPDRVFAIVEAEKGGVFRSEDGGETWSMVNSERKLRQRAWYYSRIYADSQDEDTVYVLNVGMWRSKDGGRNFDRISTPHGDHHDLWIAPQDPERLAVADDGGGQVSFNAGESWTTYMNQPTAQFYRVTTDDHFPYRVYGAQQDNSTVRILHRSGGRGIGERDWESSAGGESGWLAIDPTDQDVVFGGSYGGLLARMNHRTGENRMVNVWPDNPMGHGAEGMDPRFQWNFPIVYSRHQPSTLYAAGNRLFRTRNDGQSWEAISPDLTRNDPARLGASGGPITKDNTGVEYYCTIFSMAEGTTAGVIWAGSDDGLIHVSRDYGETWTNVTPSESFMPEWIQINSIEAHPSLAGGAYIAATMYKSDDFRPYLYRTRDYGASWERINQGIPDDAFTRVVRADPQRAGLLYCGTETGIYVSFDDGGRWRPLQFNLPQVPITDLVVKNNDLVVATQGRSFWILDDLTPLHQWNAEIAASDSWLYTPRPSYRMGGGRQEESATQGQNPHSGVVAWYSLSEEAAEKELSIDVLSADGEVIRSFPDPDDAAEEEGGDDNGLSVDPGLNRFTWGMRYPDAAEFDGMILWAGGVGGPRAVPGDYQMRLNVGEESHTVAFQILQDPRSASSLADLQQQFDFLLTARDKLSEAHDAIVRIREIRQQIEALQERLEAAPEESVGEAEAGSAAADAHGAVRAAAEELSTALTAIEERLYQTKNQSSQDPLNFPIRLNNKLSALISTVARGDYRPTDQAQAVYQKLSSAIDQALGEMSALLQNDLPSLNALAREAEVPAIVSD